MNPLKTLLLALLLCLQACSPAARDDASTSPEPGRVLKVLADGDSWTKGTKSTTPPYHTWRTRVQESGALPALDWVGKQTLGDAPDPDNNGIDASRMAAHQGIWLWQLLADYQPDVVIMCLAINDAYDGLPDIQAYKQYWRDVSIHRPGALMLWILPPNVWGAAPNGVNLDAFRAAVPAAVAELEAEGLHVHLHDWQGVLSVPDDLIVKNHPDSGGHDKLGDSLLPALVDLLSP